MLEKTPKTLLFVVQQAPWATCLHWFLLLPKSCRRIVEVGPGGGAHSVNLCYMWWALGLCNPRFYKGSYRKPYWTLALDGDTVSNFQVFLLYRHPWTDILGQKTITRHLAMQWRNTFQQNIIFFFKKKSLNLFHYYYYFYWTHIEIQNFSFSHIMTKKRKLTEKDISQLLDESKDEYKETVP